ncbi:hypothetical protein J6590_004407 [Homalodisca vitripennis]|nr:hypothetical protein J6590_004407 [Homalodisca vitripennis]
MKLLTYLTCPVDSVNQLKERAWGLECLKRGIWGVQSSKSQDVRSRVFQSLGSELSREQGLSFKFQLERITKSSDQKPIDREDVVFEWHY